MQSLRPRPDLLDLKGHPVRSHVSCMQAVAVQKQRSTVTAPKIFEASSCSQDLTGAEENLARGISVPTSAHVLFYVVCHHVTVSDLKAIPLLIITVAKGLPHSAELSSALPCPCYSWCQHWAWLGPLIRIVSGQYLPLQHSPVLQGSFFEERQAPGKWPWIQCPSRGENK